MTIEEKLKDLIRERYGSLREFVLKIDMPYSTFDSIMRRGVKNSKVENIITICKALNISADRLAEGEIVASPVRDDPGDKEIMNILKTARERLSAYEGLTFNGSPADPESVSSILDAMEVGLALALKKKKGDTIVDTSDHGGSDPVS